MQAHTARSASMEISMIPAVCSRLCDVDFSSSSSCRIRFVSVLSIVGLTSRSARVLQDPHLFYLKAAEGQPQVPPVCADPHRAAQFHRNVDFALAGSLRRQPTFPQADHLGGLGQFAAMGTDLDEHGLVAGAEPLGQ